MSATTTDSAARFTPGALVTARGREWVVLPPEAGLPDVLMVRPLGGTDADATGIYLPLEGDDVRSARFPRPTVDDLGDSVAAGLLRDAVRLNFRAGAGPFRSLGRIAVEPRPYQLVPLLMALRLEPVRLLIADDVGIGKTVEAALIARELLDRGEIARLAVVCPPHLCDQWQGELRRKFAIEAEVVRPGTIARLERGLSGSQSIFGEYPFLVISVDYLKTDKARHAFMAHCPELVIVDEAHTCAAGASTSGGQHQRHALVAEIAADPERHLILTTATPHSGVEEAFRSLLALLDPGFANLPTEGAIEASDPLRQRLARHLIQRRRKDIETYLGEETLFPERLTAERAYTLSAPYRKLFEQVYEYATELVRAGEGMTTFQQRVRWWAALALLRCVGSSPDAAAATLRTRAGALASGDEEGDADLEYIDALGERTVMDLDTAEASDADDTVPGGDAIEGDGDSSDRARLRRMAREAEALRGDRDHKLLAAVEELRGLLDEGFRPIVFCRYIATAEYLEVELDKRLGKGTEVRAVTGQSPAEARAERVEALAAHDRRVLVATDCLSEGINLQQHFDAVVHYDLSWNPTRHEQRNGRVDRFGQERETVKTLLVYGEDNPIDQLVLKVLLRKEQAIRDALGVSVPVPVGTPTVIAALAEGIFLSPRRDARQMRLEFAGHDTAQQNLTAEWERAAEREKVSRTIFAQLSIKPEEVGREMKEANDALGNHVDTSRFVREACARMGARPVREGGGGAHGETWRLPLAELPADVLELAGKLDPGEARGTVAPIRAGFALPLPEKAEHVARTHPLVEALGSHLMGQALDGDPEAVAARCAVFRTDAVTTRTTVALIRVRMHLDVVNRGQPVSLLAEEAFPVAWTGRGAEAAFLTRKQAEALLLAQPSGASAARERRAQEAIDDLEARMPAIERIAQEAAEEVLAAHLRVRQATRQGTGGHSVRPVLPVDILGLYVLERPVE